MLQQACTLAILALRESLALLTLQPVNSTNSSHLEAEAGQQEGVALIKNAYESVHTQLIVALFFIAISIGKISILNLFLHF